MFGFGTIREASRALFWCALCSSIFGTVTEASWALFWSALCSGVRTFCRLFLTLLGVFDSSPLLSLVVVLRLPNGRD